MGFKAISTFDKIKITVQCTFQYTGTEHSVHPHIERIYIFMIENMWRYLLSDSPIHRAYAQCTFFMSNNIPKRNPTMKLKIDSYGFE